MKSKHLLIFVLLLLSTSWVHGQKKHELKLSLTGLFSKDYIPSYEVILSKQIGVELALGLDFSNLLLSEFDVNNFTSHEFSATQINPSIGGKYYFLFNKKYGNGLFIGPYIKLNYLLNREDGYVEKWEEIFNREATERVLTDKGAKSLNYGLNGGYKWIIKSNFIVELFTTLTAEEFVGKGASEFDDISSFNMDIFIKIGYRF